MGEAGRSERDAHRQGRGAAAVRLGVVAAAPADLPEGEAAVDRKGRALPSSTSRWTRRAPGAGEFVEVVAQERTGMAVSARLRGEGEGQDLGLVGGEAGEDEAGRARRGRPKNRPSAKTIRSARRRSNSSALHGPREGGRMDRREAAGVLDPEGREAADRPRAAEPVENPLIAGRSGPRPAAWRRARADRAASAGPGRDRRAPRCGRPRRCRARRAHRRRWPRRPGSGIPRATSAAPEPTSWTGPGAEHPHGLPDARSGPARSRSARPARPPGCRRPVPGVDRGRDEAAGVAGRGAARERPTSVATPTDRDPGGEPDRPRGGDRRRGCPYSCRARP